MQRLFVCFGEHHLIWRQLISTAAAAGVASCFNNGRPCSRSAISKSIGQATLRLGSETHSIQGSKGILSEQLVSMKGESMNTLKDFITKHYVPNDVPDEPEEISSEDDAEIFEKPPVKSKKIRRENN